ncbi:uncharacterized protein LOC115270471 [Aedes albopictus]|uniref:Uncharacterized protein n=1 Tax=Aedes albopictus TaxID=7160 RepID=A0ABM1YVM7_AEDAL
MKNDSDYEEEEYLVSEDEMEAEDPIASALSPVIDSDCSNISETGDDAGDGIPSDSAAEKEEKLFLFKGFFFERFYRNQLRPREMFRCDIDGNSTQDIIQSLWEAVKKHVRREVVFRDEDPNWCDKSEPDCEDIARFVTLQDKEKKKGFSITDLKHRLLVKWRGKHINVYVYVYSTNVGTNSQYQCLLRKLVAPQTPDRSGAHSTKDDAALANQLRDKHRDLEGHFSSWLLWANLINSSPAHERERLKLAATPPLELTKYFRWTPVSEAARLQSVHRGMVVANTINEGWMKGIADIKQDIALASKILQGVAHKVEVLESRGMFGSEICSAMETTMRPEETELSKTLSADVTDCEDIDHN